MTKKTKVTLTIIGIIIVIIIALAAYVYLQMAAISVKPINTKEYAVKLTYPTPKDSQNKEIQRGEYLIKVGDCISCHTSIKPGSKPFAGDFKIVSYFGNLYTPNITGDKETGIGSWSQQDFDKAMRQGISPQGYYYYPAFPYPYFNNLTDKDLKAMFTYLKAIPAVKNKVQNDTMVWPLSMRFLQFGWRTMFFSDKGPYVNNDKKSPEWNRGAYLVEGLGHCAMCHTPSRYIINEKYIIAAPITSESLSGNPNLWIDGIKWTSFNISGDSKSMIKAMPAKFVKKWIEANPRQTPMLQVKNNSIQYISDTDVEAMVTYMKTVNAPVEKPKKP